MNKTKEESGGRDKKRDRNEGMRGNGLMDGDRKGDKVEETG